MPMINIGAEDVLKSKIVTPGWYPAVVKSCNVELNSKKDANNYVTEFILAGGTFDGVPITQYFSEKAPGFMIPFIQAIGGTVTEKGGQFDPDKFAQKKLQVHVINDNYQGRVTNKIDGYKPLEAKG